MSDKEKHSEYLEKHPALTREQTAQAQIEARQVRTKYSKDLQEVETGLMRFIEKLDPVVDPETGEIVFWIKQVPIKDLLGSTPEELRELLREAENPEEAEKITKEYRKKNPESTDQAQRDMYLMMEKMVAIPKKTADEWEGIMTPDLAVLFEVAISVLYQRMNEQLSFF